MCEWKRESVSNEFTFTLSGAVECGNACEIPYLNKQTEERKNRPMFNEIFIEIGAINIVGTQPAEGKLQPDVKAHHFCNQIDWATNANQMAYNRLKLTQVDKFKRRIS